MLSKTGVALRARCCWLRVFGVSARCGMRKLNTRASVKPRPVHCRGTCSTYKKAQCDPSESSAHRHTGRPALVVVSQVIHSPLGDRAFLERGLPNGVRNPTGHGIVCANEPRVDASEGRQGRGGRPGHPLPARRAPRGGRAAPGLVAGARRGGGGGGGGGGGRCAA